MGGGFIARGGANSTLSGLWEFPGGKIENRIDRVSFYGSLDITRDKEGLAHARQLMSILEMVIKKLEKAELPDHVTIKPTASVKNPFL